MRYLLVPPIASVVKKYLTVLSIPVQMNYIIPITPCIPWGELCSRHSFKMMADMDVILPDREYPVNMKRCLSLFWLAQCMCGVVCVCMCVCLSVFQCVCVCVCLF